MLKNKVIVITGGAGLLGSEFVKEVALNGGVPIIAEINIDLGKRVKKDICLETGCQEIHVYKLDITSSASVKLLIDNLHNKFGRIDALVNNAYPRNKNYGKPFFEVKYENFVDNIGLNLGGYFNTSKLFANYFENQKYGNIINISSIYGVIPPKFEIYEGTEMTMPVEYAVIKSGLIHLTKYMAKYFKGMNIRVNTLSPGGVLDGQSKQFIEVYNEQCLTKGMLDKSDLKGSLIYLLSDMSKYLNGQNLIVDDGFTL